MNLAELKKEIPYKWRVQSFSKFKPQASCVAYVDARQVMDLLDGVVGPENWQDKYTEHKGNLFCSIGIKCGEDWVWKTDCGSESNIEQEKGEASDAFKRAAVKFGIGRFLYSLKIQYVTANQKKEGNNYPHVVDDRGQRVWDLTEYINGRNNPPYPPKQPANLPTMPEDVAKLRERLLAVKEKLEPFELEDIQQYMNLQEWEHLRKTFNAISLRMEIP